MTPLSTRMSAPRVPVFAPVAKRPQMLKLVPILQAPVGCMVAEGAKSGEAVSMHPGVPDSHLSVHLFNMSIGLEVAVPSMPPPRVTTEDVLLLTCLETVVQPRCPAHVPSPHAGLHRWRTPRTPPGQRAAHTVARLTQCHARRA